MNAILHISDLHFSHYGEESMLTEAFKLKFLKKLKGLKYQDNQEIKVKYLIVSGDISDGGAKKDFLKAKAFLEDICTEMEINKSNVLICPGNHDICWHKLQEYLDEEENPTKEPHEYHDIKFEKFKNFYNDFFEGKKTFFTDNAVVDVIINDEDKLVLVGLNSCFRESFKRKDHYGFIDFDSLNKKLNEISDKIIGYNKLVIMHHNPNHFKNEEVSVKNWSEIIELLDDFPSVINGHIHSSNGESITTRDSKYFVSVGSFSKKDVKIKNAFNILLKNPQDSTKYKVLYYEYENKETPYWQLHDENNAIPEITLNSEKGESVLSKISADNEDANFPVSKSFEEPTENNEKTVEKRTKSYNELIDDLIRIIVKKKLFKSGHFHWSPDFRSHGIIDINYLISHRKSMDLIYQLFYLKISKILHDKEIQPDLIVGIGITGNAIGSLLSVLFPSCDYSFVPDELKEEYSVFEKTIKDGEYKNILLIKDIIYVADTLNEVFEHDIFNEIDNILMFSLFYCGKKGTEHKVFDGKENVLFNSICNKIVIERCPHKGDVKECSIVEYKLDTFYELYTKQDENN